MAATLQHACNRVSETDPSIFRNDVNNVAALQNARLQKKLMEEAAHLQQKQLEEAAEKLRSQVEDTEKIKRERFELSEKAASLQKAVEQEQGKLEESRKEIERLKQDNQEAQNKIEGLKRQKEGELATLKSQKEGELATLENKRQELKGQVDTKEAEIASLKQTIVLLEKQVPIGPQNDCLPLQYNGATVMIVNLGSQLALDAGKDNGTKALAWEYNVTNPNQIFTLSKYNNIYWIISRKDNGQRLYFPNENTGVEVQVGLPPGIQDLWTIGRGSNTRVGSWVFRNAQWGTYIELENGTKNNGVRAMSYPLSDRLDQNWVIIPFGFAN